ncbi:Hypothetical predicted protein [Octopus vulgaris]|uniref:Uncharacterized protein n=1 Tax=Octopus vulgaris TaxID=6645 RepID=A0AA36BIL4_OCTVU|nr:Hypothetical predicted protein [Octopus vulgaris]
MVGDVLLLPANIDILNPEGIAYDMIHIGGGSIKAELQKVDTESIGYGCITQRNQLINRNSKPKREEDYRNQQRPQ